MHQKKALSAILLKKKTEKTFFALISECVLEGDNMRSTDLTGKKFGKLTAIEPKAFKQRLN